MITDACLTLPNHYLSCDCVHGQCSKPMSKVKVSKRNVSYQCVQMYTVCSGYHLLFLKTEAKGLK